MPGKAKTIDATDIFVGERIRALRNAKGLSQTDLANALGVTFQQVQKYEKGVNRVSTGRLAMIAKQLGADIMDFYPKTANSREASGAASNDPCHRMAQSKRGVEFARLFITLKGVQQDVLITVAKALQK